MPVVVYDLKLRRPGCVLLQAVMGGTIPASTFPSDSWLLAPTPDMKAYNISDEELAKLKQYHERKSNEKI